MRHRPFLIIRGAPGTGKSKTASQLARHFPNGATIEVDLVRRMMNGIVWHRHQQHFDAIHVTVHMAQAFAARGYAPVIIVDTLGFGALEMALEEFGEESVGVYSLICDPVLLTLRLWRRLGGFRDAKKGRRFNAHIMSEGRGESEPINTARLKPHAVCRRILELERTACADSSPSRDPLH